MKGYYSFIEDFKRDRVSATRERRGAFEAGLGTQQRDGRWTPLARARFTADGNPSLAIDAGEAPAAVLPARPPAERAANTHTPLGQAISIAEAPHPGADGHPAGYPPLP